MAPLLLWLTISLAAFAQPHTVSGRRCAVARGDPRGRSDVRIPSIVLQTIGPTKLLDASDALGCTCFRGLGHFIARVERHNGIRRAFFRAPADLVSPRF